MAKYTIVYYETVVKGYVNLANSGIYFRDYVAVFVNKTSAFFNRRVGCVRLRGQVKKFFEFLGHSNIYLPRP